MSVDVPLNRVMIKQNTEEWLQGPTLGIWIRELHVHLTVSVEAEAELTV